MKWRAFADRELRGVFHDLGIPSALPSNVTGMTRCPRHYQPLGSVTRMCVTCHDEAWGEVGRRYLQGRTAELEGRAVPRQFRKPAPGQQSLLGQETTYEEETMNTSTEHVQAELLPVLIEEIAPAPVTLFGTSDPEVALQKMSEVATALVDVIKDRKLFARIGGHEHVTAEGWTTLGGMLGIVPVVVWTKPNETEDGYIARVEARTLDGRVVGAAESECSRAERRWKAAEPYAIRSMAQTRAIGRALRAPLGQIVVLAGYAPASAEEMPTGGDDAAKPDPSRPTILQEQRLRDLFGRLQDAAPEVDWASRCSAAAGRPSAELTGSDAERVIEQMSVWVANLQGDESGR